MKALYKENSIDVENLQEDLHFTQNKINTALSALSLRKLDVSLIPNTRDFLYKSLKELIKCKFIFQKQHQIA